MFIKVLLFFLVLTLPLRQSLSCQNNHQNGQKLDYLIYNFPQEKIYINSDRSQYVVGDTLWFAVWGTNATFHDKNPVSQLVYVQLANEKGDVLESSKIQLKGKNGHGYLVVHHIGNLTLRAYTSYMLNFDSSYLFSRNIKVYSGIDTSSTGSLKLKNEVNLRFFPEGGHLVEGLESILAFEASYDDGSPCQVEISIFNEQNQMVSSGKTLHDGIGICVIKPEKNKKYYALYNKNKYEIPQPIAQGVVLKVTNRNPDHFTVKISTNLMEGLQNIKMLCHTRGEVFFVQDQLTGNDALIKVSKEDIETGISQILILDKQGIPLTERAIFIYNQKDEVKSEITTPYIFFNPRDAGKINISLYDNNNRPIKGKFSISIVDENEIDFHSDKLDIKNYFFLNSDVSTPIRNPGYYLNNYNTHKAQLLDLQMIVKQWTRIKSEYFAGVTTPNISHFPELGVKVSGKLFYKKKPISGAFVDLIVLESMTFFQTITDSSGNFNFHDLPIKFGDKLLLKGYFDEKKGNKGKIKFNDNAFTFKIILDSIHQKVQFPNNNESDKNIFKKEFPENHKHKTDIDNYSFNDGLSVQIEEVEISTRRLSDHHKLNAKHGIKLYSFPDKRVILDSLDYYNPAWRLKDLIQRIGNSRDQSISKPFSLFTNVYIDGEPFLGDHQLINLEDIEFIDILRDVSKTSIYNLKPPVFQIYMKKNKTLNASSKTNKTNVNQFFADGFQIKREYYTPLHTDSMPDLRTTLCWTPSLQTDDKGKATIEFRTCDKRSKYVVVIEGMTEDGVPFTGHHRFKVE